MKKEFKAPEFEVAAFEVVDVLTTSVIDDTPTENNTPIG